MDNQLTIGDAGSLLMGAGLAKLDTTFGLVLIGIGVVLKVLVAFLQKEGVNVQVPGPNSLG